MTQVFITSGTTWTVPADWNSANNSLEVVGGGGGGEGNQATRGGGGGGGGAYSKAVNQTYTASASITIQVGAAGSGGLNSTDGTDTFVKNNANSANAVLAAGGSGGTPGGLGGNLGAGVGSTTTSGGSGGPAGSISFSGGGGGAGGAAGDGQAGTSSGSGNGGAGNANTGGGGAGGTTGNAGGTGTNFDATHGSGGGGGGAASPSGSGAAGGNYGAGGGGGFNLTAGGNGTQGIIVITYTPAAPSAKALTEQPAPVARSRGLARARATALLAAHIVGIESVPQQKRSFGFERQPLQVRRARAVARLADDGGALRTLGSTPAVPTYWQPEAAPHVIARAPRRIQPIESWPLDAVAAAVVASDGWVQEQPPRAVSKLAARSLPIESVPLDGSAAAAAVGRWLADRPQRIAAKPQVRFVADDVGALQQQVATAPLLWGHEVQPAPPRRGTRVLAANAEAIVAGPSGLWFESAPLRITWRRSPSQVVDGGWTAVAATAAVPLLWGYESQPTRPRIVWRTPWVANGDPVTTLGDVPSPAQDVPPVTSAGNFFGLPHPPDLQRKRKPEETREDALPDGGRSVAQQAYATARIEASLAARLVALAARDAEMARLLLAARDLRAKAEREVMISRLDAEAQQLVREWLAEIAADDEDVLLLSA